MEKRPRTLADKVALTQGIYFAATGVWPIVHLPSFEAVTGPKLEGWLVKTVGALIAVVGGTLVVAAALVGAWTLAFARRR